MVLFLSFKIFHNLCLTFLSCLILCYSPKYIIHFSQTEICHLSTPCFNSCFKALCLPSYLEFILFHICIKMLSILKTDLKSCSYMKLSTVALVKRIICLWMPIGLNDQSILTIFAIHSFFIAIKLSKWIQFISPTVL